MKKTFYSIFFIFIILIQCFSQDSSVIDTLKSEWSKYNYEEEATICNLEMKSIGQYIFSEGSFNINLTVQANKKIYFELNRSWDQEFLEEFPDVPVPYLSFYELKEPFESVPPYILNQYIKVRHKNVNFESPEYFELQKDFLDYVTHYSGTVLRKSEIDSSLYIYYPPIDEFILIWAP